MLSWTALSSRRTSVQTDREITHVAPDGDDELGTDGASLTEILPKAERGPRGLYWTTVVKGPPVAASRPISSVRTVSSADPVLGSTEQ